MVGRNVEVLAIGGEGVGGGARIAGAAAVIQRQVAQRAAKLGDDLAQMVGVEIDSEQVVVLRCMRIGWPTARP